jgi:hypothetical protein
MENAEHPSSRSGQNRNSLRLLRRNRRRRLERRPRSELLRLALPLCIPSLAAALGLALCRLLLRSRHLERHTRLAEFLSDGPQLHLPIAIWTGLVVLATAPWVAFYSRRYLPLSAIAALAVLALPPLSLVTVAHPLIAAGYWFPGTRWFGLGLPIILIAAYQRFGTAMTIAVLIAASIATHARFHRPLPDPHILAVNTNFGGQSPHDDVLTPGWSCRSGRSNKLRWPIPTLLLIFPESIIPNWNGMHETRWASVFAQLKQQRTGLLIGTTIPIPNTEANRNVLLSRGYTERFSYVQRVPVPLGMWHIGDQRSGFPLMLRFPPTIRFGIAAPGYWSATSSSHSGRPSKLSPTTPICCLRPPTSTGRPTRRFQQFSTWPRKIGPTSGPSHSTRQATDENSDRNLPALLCRESPRSTAGRCRSPIALPPHCSAHHAQRHYPR